MGSTTQTLRRRSTIQSHRRKPCIPYAARALCHVSTGPEAMCHFLAQIRTFERQRGKGSAALCPSL
jgi:hypothetical protein